MNGARMKVPDDPRQNEPHWPRHVLADILMPTSKPLKGKYALVNKR
jgi:hypothetical protein